MLSVPGMPLPKTAQQIRDELKRLREKHPNEYASAAAPLIAELDRLEKTKHRYAIT